MTTLFRLLFIALLASVAAVAVEYYANEQVETTYIETEVTRGSIVHSISAVGSFRPIGMVEISSSTSGQIAEVNADFNDTVKAGDVLAVIDRRVLQANLREAEAQRDVALANAQMTEARIAKAQADLADAKIREDVAKAEIEGFVARHGYSETELKRAQSLAERQNIPVSEVERAEFTFQASQADLEVARLELEVAKMRVISAEAEVMMANAELSNATAVVQQREAAVNRTQIELDRAIIRAPIDGFIVGRSVELGQTVSASLEAPTLFTLAENLQNMDVHAIVDESDIVRTKLDQSVKVTVDALPDQEFGGRVKQIRRLSDDSDGVVTFTIILSVENPDLILLPGMTALLDIIVAERTDVLSISNAAFRFRPPDGRERLETLGMEASTSSHKKIVWQQVAPGELQPVEVETGLTDGSTIEILGNDLSEGDRIVVGTRVTRETRGLFGLKLGLQ